MTIRRSPRPADRFLRVDNEVIDDPRLSLKSLGLLVKILRRPDNWKTDRDSLARDCKEGVTAIRAALVELKEAGYLIQTKTQNDRGHWATETVVFDRPQLAGGVLTDGGKPTAGPTRQDALFSQVAPAAENPTVGFPATKVLTTDKELLTTKTFRTLADANGGANAGLVVKELIDKCTFKGKKLTKRSIGQYAKQIKGLLDEGFEADTIRRALASMLEEDIIDKPSWLDSRVIRAHGPSLASASSRPGKHTPFKNYTDPDAYGDSLI